MYDCSAEWFMQNNLNREIIMPYTPSPLRYPGGKTSIFPLLSHIIDNNNLRGGHYAEPYAGGAGLALSLLLKNVVHEIHLNDLDRSVWCIWNSILNQTQDFIELINTTPITIDEWHRQKEIQSNKENADSLSLGFSSFFLNRTNRSGIIQKAGVIGGLEQNGKYKIDCRFNRNGLISRINKIALRRNDIHLYNLDAVDFIKDMDTRLPLRSLLYIDPPYFEKGQSLYTNYYNKDDHTTLSENINNINSHWILTYDLAEEIKELYLKHRQYSFSLQYSAQIKRRGTELLVCSDNLTIPQNTNLTAL